ncbi:MAG: PH domain-containing protein [Anaerolineae bacterium]|jgi:hypothetical protein|nr:PH domain-containing protein [Anaerolineae bacterium]
MPPSSRYAHPSPLLYRVQQVAVLALLAALLVAAALQLLLALLLSSILFALMSVGLVLLAAPVLMLRVVSPPVDVEADGLRLRPLFGRERVIAWGDILRVRDYTLLPQPDQERERRALQGRKNYRPAQGKMLVVRGLPPVYRIAGFFAGERAQPIIALTTRTHTDYERLVQQVLARVPPAARTTE